MSKKRRKKSYTRAGREAFRVKAEKEQRLAGAAGLRRKNIRKGTPAEVPPAIKSSRYDSNRILDQMGYKFTTSQRARFLDLFEVIRVQRPGLFDAPYRDGLAMLVWTEWLRDPEAWRPDGRGLGAAFRSLAAHLTGRYPISPYFWDSMLIRPDGRKMVIITPRVFAHIAQGESLRDLVGTKLLPVPLTRRMVHILGTPRCPMPLEKMVRRAQVLGYGGTENFAKSLGESRLVRFRENEGYWADVIHWFCRQSDLDVVQLDPILDFLITRYSEDTRVDLKGRTVASVMRGMEQWHGELADLKEFRKRVFDPSGFKGGVWRAVRRKEGRKVPGEVWAVREVLTAKDLVTEGRSMRHCVASYRDVVASRHTSIWSLTEDNRRKLTVEVHNGSRTVMQVRGKGNRLPKVGELKYLMAWVEKNGFKVMSREVEMVLG